MRASTFTILPALALLVACGGGGGGGDASDDGPVPIARNAIPATSVVEGFPEQTLPGWQAATYLPATDQIVVYPRATLGGGGSVATVRTLSRNLTPEIAMPANFSAYIGTSAQRQAVRGVTPGGSGTAYAARLIDRGIERGHERIGETTLPTSGGAIYTGTYAGVLGDASFFLEDAGLITGTAQLDANFASGTISGRISGRENGSGRAFGVVTLPASAIDATDGSFGGTTSGGLLTGLGYTGAEGTFSGLIVGANGEEAVGGLNITHTRAGAPTISEYGVFVAGQ
jgi:hypothetical protein